MKHPKIPQTEVLEWLAANYPALHASAEIDRDWVWLAVNLQGDQNKPVREAIKEYGFIFHRKGGHLLPSGKLGMWGHSCERPTQFTINKRNRATTVEDSKTKSDSLTDDVILAMFGR